jgi:GT2 family glycosyltransferase
MNITLVLAVYNRLELTRKCYELIRRVYTDAPMVISSGGSTDGTKEWLASLNDDNLSYIHDDDKLTFSDNYNTAMKLVDTEKFVLIHNDMVIGKYFLENLDKILTPDMVLSYQTVEPPVFSTHMRPGKTLLAMGTSFDDFNQKMFDDYVEKQKDLDDIYYGSSFFMSGYVSMFKEVGGFDGFTFNPVFCEDDDFLLRAKLKGFRLRTTFCAVVYHFVSQTSRFGTDFIGKRETYETNSNVNFIRKWGVSVKTIKDLRYWEDENFKFSFFKIGITLKNLKFLYLIEPFFDKIALKEIPDGYINENQTKTNYDLRTKFLFTNEVDVMVYEISEITTEDLQVISLLRLSIPHYEIGDYKIGNLIIKILKNEQYDKI